MKTFTQSRIIESTINEVWEFFSDPRNLSRITPPEMDFKILNDQLPDTIYPGMIIRYRVKPIFGISMTWVTEITQASSPYYFVDDQKSGPYRFWHHQHLFREVPGGVEITDIVNFAAPFGVIGKLMERLFIYKKVKAIFQYRDRRIQEYF